MHTILSQMLPASAHYFRCPSPPGAIKHSSRFPIADRFSVALLYGRAERVTAKHGGFRAGRAVNPPGVDDIQMHETDPLQLAQLRQRTQVRRVRRPGRRHRHSTLSLGAIDGYSLGIYAVLLLLLLSFSVKMTVSPVATASPSTLSASL